MMFIQVTLLKWPCCFCYSLNDVDCNDKKYYSFTITIHFLNNELGDSCKHKYISKVWSDIYTQTKVKQHHIFFGDIVMKVAERNLWLMEI